jgi:hypothetical protein
MIGKFRAILQSFVDVIWFFILGFPICLGLGLLWKWMELPAGYGLTKHQITDVMDTALFIASGMALGEYARQKWPRRSKLKE